LALLNCRKAFSAALEHALLVTKIAWAFGWTSQIVVGPDVSDDCPASMDKSIYLERYLRDARGVGERRGSMTTELFVECNLADRGTTYRTTRLTLSILGVSAFVVGLGGTILTVGFRFCHGRQQFERLLIREQPMMGK